MTACPTLVTERLILRPFEEYDLDAFTEMMAAPDVRAALRVPDTSGREEAWLAMAQWRGQWELRSSGQFALEERASGRFVGRAGLDRPEREDWPGMEVGWAIDPRWWGKGYATEAGLAIVAYAFEVMGMERLYSVILPGASKSEAVATRLGFELEVVRNLSHHPAEAHGIWRLDRSRWEASPHSGPRPDPMGLL